MTRIPKMFTFLCASAILVLACGQINIGIETTPGLITPTTPATTAANSEGGEVDSPTHTPEPIQSAGSGDGLLDCSQFGADPLMAVACNIQDSFNSRNTSPLLGYMPDEFILAYWQSEGTMVTPEYALDYFNQTMLPPVPQQMTFTIDRSKFPPLFGTPPETIFGPVVDPVLIIYSEGWGPDGQGAVLIYISEHANNGGYYFPAILVASGHFDK